MTSVTTQTDRSHTLYRVAIIIGIVAVLAKAISQAPSAMSRLISGDNDDIMRLMQVRAWLAGQSWFDLTQYRMLPPEGISLHWSRYIDLGLAGIIVPLSKVMPMAQAEQWALVIWPTALMMVLVLVVAHGTYRLLGGIAACGAVGCLITWVPISGLYFDVGRIDHHNVQILATTILAIGIILPGHPVRRGIIAGIAAAFSLAIGLETLPFIVTVGAMLVVRAAFEQEGANQFLAAFCAALFCAAMALFVGQTAPDAWLQPLCDKLSSPVFALILIATAASLGPMVARRWLTTPWARIAASVAFGGIGLWISAPLLGPCTGGPYAALPLDLRIMIGRDILEAQPALVWGRTYPISLHSFFTPAVAAFGIAIAFWLQRWRHGSQSPVEHVAVVQMLILAGIGLIGSLFQLRMIILAAPALPFLTGFAIRELVKRRQSTPSARNSVLLVIGLIAMLLATQLNGPLAAVMAYTHPEGSSAQQTSKLDQNCRLPGDLEALNALPPSTIMSTMNLAPAMILTTHHNAIAAPYHRNAAAMWNGTYQFNNFGAMQRALQTSGATYVILCRTATHGPKRMAARALIDGDVPAWLRPVPLDSPNFLVFETVPDALGP
jgi:hypothetical protein